MHSIKNTKGSVLVVDDDLDVLRSITEVIRMKGFSVNSCNSGAEVLTRVKTTSPEVVLSDIKMPGITGLDLLGMIHEYDPDLPVILITAYANLDSTITAIKRRAFDFLMKPYKSDELIRSLESAVYYRRKVMSEKRYTCELEETVEERTRKLTDVLRTLKNASKEMIQTLAAVAEYRDTDTGNHIKRIGLYSKKIAEVLCLPEEFVETVAFSSTLHDIGKVGIPDSILLKPGALTPEEFEIIRNHTTIGSEMLSRATYPGMDMAASIALNHHERWDGTGYPLKLKGEDIPVESRIVMIVDQYDALRSKRPYKQPFDHETAFKLLTEGDGRVEPEHFDPDVLNAFVETALEFDAIFETYQDSGELSE